MASRPDLGSIPGLLAARDVVTEETLYLDSLGTRNAYNLLSGLRTQYQRFRWVEPICLVKKII